jgi:hypothetical protein
MNYFRHLLVPTAILILTACGHDSFVRSASLSTSLEGPGTSQSPEGPGNPVIEPPVIEPPVGEPTATPTATPPPDATPTPTPTATPTATPTPAVTTPCTDRYQQSYTNKTDIVWVIDNSGSMGDDQQSIHDNASLFTQKLISANVDFQLIVVTTDASYNGDLQNKCGTILKSATAADFAECALVGYWGSDSSIPDSSNREEGLEAARRALDPQYVNGALNTNFLRSDADLQLIFVSDEEDQPDADSWASIQSSDQISALKGEMTSDLADSGRAKDGREAYFPILSNHVAFFNGLKSGTGKSVHAHAIVTQDLSGASGSCHHRDSTEEIGKRYMTFASIMGGSSSDVCGTWSQTMNNLGLEASGLNKCFTLTHAPVDPDQIQVKINGITLVDGFTYVASGIQVCLNTIPPAGATVDVSYEY